jgi:hypothetical protein
VLLALRVLKLRLRRHEAIVVFALISFIIFFLDVPGEEKTCLGFHCI